VTKFDKYLLSQLLLYFGFFALILVALFWITRAVPLFDRLISDGQSVLVFLELSILSFPKLIFQIMPLASFAAAAFVTNQLSSESELTIVFATGSSPWRLAWPVLVFALCVALMASLLSHILVPASQERLAQRQNEINRDMTARLLTEGIFLHPSKGVTLYTGEIGEDGVLRRVFLADHRDPSARVSYSAASAYLVRKDGQTSLIMIDGTAQRLSLPDMRLATARFQDFSHDISTLVDLKPSFQKDVAAYLTWDLFADWDNVSEQTGQRLGVISEEFHARFAQALFAAIAGLIGHAALVSRGFSRFSAWREIMFAIALLLFLDGLRAALVENVLARPALWPIAYVPSILGAMFAAGLLAIASTPILRRLGRRSAS
jgi:lipopolysaccharide export system permease protein